MQPSQDGAGWLAANLDGNTLTAWKMPGSSAKQVQSLPVADGTPHGLAAALHKALDGNDWPVLLGGSLLAAPQQVPAQPAQLQTVQHRMDGLTIHALPALCQSGPAALMRGAIARLSGFLHLNPDWDGVVCLPGAVTHWVQVSAREAVSFQSAITSQLAQSALQSMAEQFPEGAEADTLAETAADGIAKPELLAARLASVQAEAALGLITPETICGRVWGLLLGAELAAARPYWLGQNVALIAPAPLQPMYAAALEAQGLPFTLADPLRMTLEGLQRSLPGS